MMTMKKIKQATGKQCLYREIRQYAGHRLFLIVPKKDLRSYIMDEDRERFSKPVEVVMHHSSINTGMLYVRELERDIVYPVDSTKLTPWLHLTKAQKEAVRKFETTNGIGIQVTVQMLVAKLDANSSKLDIDKPVGLHAWPKRENDGFCAIGNIDWGKDATSIGDVFVGRDRQHYHKINDMLRQACEICGYTFVSMS